LWEARILRLLFSRNNTTIPSSHPDCSFRDTIFLVSSQLYTCTLHSTTPPTTYLIASTLSIGISPLLLPWSVLEWPFGFLLALGGRRNKLCLMKGVHQIDIYERKASESGIWDGVIICLHRRKGYLQFASTSRDD
jgi:hypothetical protein